MCNQLMTFYVNEKIAVSTVKSHGNNYQLLRYYQKQGRPTVGSSSIISNRCVGNMAVQPRGTTSCICRFVPRSPVQRGFHFVLRVAKDELSSDGCDTLHTHVTAEVS